MGCFSFLQFCFWLLASRDESGFIRSLRAINRAVSQAPGARAINRGDAEYPPSIGLGLDVLVYVHLEVYGLTGTQKRIGCLAMSYLRARSWRRRFVHTLSAANLGRMFRVAAYCGHECSSPRGVHSTIAYSTSGWVFGAPDWGTPGI